MLSVNLEIPSHTFADDRYKDHVVDVRSLAKMRGHNGDTTLAALSPRPNINSACRRFGLGLSGIGVQGEEESKRLTVSHWRASQTDTGWVLCKLVISHLLTYTDCVGDF